MRTLVVTHNLLDPLNTRLREVLRRHVDPQGPALVLFEDVETRLPQVPADMLVVVLSSEPERGLEVLAKLRQQVPGYLLAVGQASEPKLILGALHQGADHFLDEAELESGLEAALSRMHRKEENTALTGRVVAVLGSSGGSGGSTLSVNLAAVLAKEHQRCALIDLKAGRGDLAALLDLKPAFTLADLCLNLSRLDRAMFEKVLIAHPCGVHLLGAPQMFGSTRVVSAQGVGQALAMARRLFPYVLVDLEDCFHEEQVLTIGQAAAIVLVVRLDFTSLRNARRILDHLNELEIPETQVRLVANRYGQAGELPVGEAEKALGMKIAHYVPDDPKTINAANNLGIPAVLRAPSAKASLGITRLAKVLLERRRGEAPAAIPLLVR
jgi:pilus assembly protein CpaE